jgi:hypothetical protein
VHWNAHSKIISFGGQLSFSITGLPAEVRRTKAGGERGIGFAASRFVNLDVELRSHPKSYNHKTFNAALLSFLH